MRIITLMRTMEVSLSGQEKLKNLEAIDDFFVYLQTNNYSPKTLYNYEKDLITFADFLTLRKITIFNLDKKLINEFKAYLASNDRQTPVTSGISDGLLSPASINRNLSAVRAYIRFLIDTDIKCPVSPDQFKMVKKERLHPHVADLNELIALIESPSKLETDALIATRNRAILEVLFSTGMRISEIVSLNRRDINKSGRIFITGKGRRQRFVYLTDRALEVLNNYLNLREDKQEALFVPTKGNTMNNVKQRLTPRYIQEKIKQYRETLKIDLPISPHTLRHGFATYLAEEGASPVAIQILLGHESLNTTTRYVNASDKFAENSHHKYHPLAKKQ